MTKKANNKLRLAVEIALIPLFFCVFMFDRAMGIFQIWRSYPSIRRYAIDQKEIQASLIRVVIYLAIIGLIALIVWI